MYIAACVDESFGYGYFTNSIIRGLLAQNIDVRIWPLLGHQLPADLAPFGLSQPAHCFDVIFCPVLCDVSSLTASVLFTMYEATAMPAAYGAHLERFKHIIVPTEFAAGAMRTWHDSVHIVPLGVDMRWSPTAFKPFTFTTVAADHGVPERKRIQEIVDTFQQAFPREDDVRLVLKRNPECTKICTFDSRVKVYSGRMTRSAYNTLLAETTVGVHLSAMEGWGLPVNEFMAMGRPVIAPRAGAIGEFLPVEAAFPLECSMVPSPQNIFEGVGEVPYASTQSLAAQMRFAYENPIEVVRRGLAAYAASTNFTTHTMTQHFLNVCQRLLS